MSTQAEKAGAFRALHERDGAFLIPNPWDAGTARLLAGLGFEALATTSAGYALAWMGHRRPESLKQQIMTDVHAPAFLRVNGPLANVPEFYEAFGVKKGDKMWRSDNVRVEIW